MVIERICVSGLVIFKFFVCGYELWIGLNIGVFLFVEVDGSNFIELLMIDFLLVRILLKVFFVIIILKNLGFWIIFIVVLFINI